MSAMTANQLRRAWSDFFERHRHTVVPSAGLIPTHPTAPLFTNAGMNPFVPYFLGEESPSFRRATSVQKCVRTGDIEIVGTTTRHLTFFEMLGNFSFGDYFKEEAIRLAWQLSTEVFGFDGDRIWATVYVEDDEAEEIWRSTIGLPDARVLRLGDEDNFWEMQKGAPGPCGPNSELHYDRGPEFGAEGGPAVNDERFLEFWNLVFMQFNRQPDGSLADLPSKNVDTGAGFERNLVLLQDVKTVFETDALAPLVATAERLSDRRYGADDRADVSLRIMADHARTVSFLVSDGVFPSNEGRGYVLRRLIRRAVRHAYLLGIEQLVTPALVDATVELMGEAYPGLEQNATFVRDVVVREEERFRETLRAGTNLLSVELDKVPAGGALPGSVAFLLHDTHGFPLELTREIAAERELAVDDKAFDAAMAEQKRRAKQARARDGVSDDAEPYAELLEQFGATEFTGRDEYESKARVLAVFDDAAFDHADGQLGDGGGRTSIVLDRSPFYAESGGQAGDTGTIRSDTGLAEVYDTRLGVPGMHRHLARVVDGEFRVGQEVTAAIDAERRDAIRRNHTATHLLHWALRQVLGDHVKQQGSLVAPDRLRFDFSHYEPMTADEVRAVEDLVNTDVLANFPARHYETTKDYATQIGAIAFFGDKYGDIVRVLEAGPHSTELCGGTHVRALGDIGPVKIVSESSIGSNLRRLEAISGFGPIERLRDEEARIASAADALGVGTDELVDAVERQRAEVKELRDEMKALKRRLAAGRATELGAQAIDGVVVARIDDLERDALRDLALAVRDLPGIDAVVLGGAPAEGGVALVAGAATDRFDASALIAEAAKTVKGGGGKHPDLAVAGGKDPAALDAALDQARAAAGLPPEGASGAS
jgi:alanyl-tRNA synthetase